MQQVDKGKLKLDQDVQKYLGGLQIPNQTGNLSPCLICLLY